jgi:hypothetical protein
VSTAAECAAEGIPPESSVGDDGNIGPDEFQRVVYVGDGKNDLCPCLELLRSPHDIVLARRSEVCLLISY